MVKIYNRNIKHILIVMKKKKKKKKKKKGLY